VSPKFVFSSHLCELAVALVEAEQQEQEQEGVSLFVSCLRVVPLTAAAAAVKKDEVMLSGPWE